MYFASIAAAKSPLFSTGTTPSIAKNTSLDDPIKTIMAMQAQATISAFEANKNNQPNFENDEDFGLVPEKPIYTLATDVVEGERAYLDQLRTADGQKIKYERRGSLSVEGINGIIDGYDIFSLSGERLATIFINMYGAKKSRKAPKGFVFSTASSPKQTSTQETSIATSPTHKKEKPPKEPKERKPLSKKAKRIILWSTISVASLAIIAVLVFCWIIPSTNYNKAQALLEAEEYDLAYTAFEKLNGYSDSEDKLLEIRYLQAKQLRDTGDYKAANAIFESLSNYRDSKALIHKHNYIITSEIKPTCTTDGHTTYTCQDCKDTYTTSQGATHSHDYKMTATTDSTCTAQGSEKYTCTLCGDYYITPIDASHKYVLKNHTEAKCNSIGEFVYECQLCKHTYSEAIAMTSHVFKEATCTTPKTCEGCGKTEGQAFGHTNTLVCTRCGDTTFETIELTGTGDASYTNVYIPAGVYNITMFYNSNSSYSTLYMYLESATVYESFSTYKEVDITQESLRAINNGIINISANGTWTIRIEAVGN